MNLRQLTPRQKTAILLGILFVILIVIIIGYLVTPTLIYDQWIWKYYWGPVVADATGHSVSYHGIDAQEGYTLVSELTYGIILVCALYGLYVLLKKLEIKIDWFFCLALLPYILFGPVTRVLEDTNYYTEPFVYWFISPLIYFQTAFYVLFFLLIGYVLHKKTVSLNKILLILSLLFLLINGCYAVLWFQGVSFGASNIEPWFFAVLSLIAFLPLLFRFLRKQTPSINTIVFSGGLIMVLPCFFLIGRWVLGEPWGSSYGTYINVLALVMSLVFLIVAAVYLIAWVNRKHDAAAVYTHPLNLSMLAGHLIDGITSYVSIYDPLRMGLPAYIEKHPASNTLMGFWPPLFPIVKFLLILLVIYIFDILYKKELERYSRLVNLLKIGIFILGVSPGLRDLLRVTMGV